MEKTERPVTAFELHRKVHDLAVLFHQSRPGDGGGIRLYNNDVLWRMMSFISILMDNELEGIPGLQSGFEENEAFHLVAQAVYLLGWKLTKQTGVPSWEQRGFQREIIDPEI